MLSTYICVQTYTHTYTSVDALVCSHNNCDQRAPHLQQENILEQYVVRVLGIFLQLQERVTLRTVHPQVLQVIIDGPPLREMDCHVGIDCAFFVRIPYVGPEDKCTPVCCAGLMLHTTGMHCFSLI